MRGLGLPVPLAGAVPVVARAVTVARSAAGLAGAGAEVAIVARRIDAVRETADEIESATGRRTAGFAADVGRWEELEPLVDPERALDPETPPIHPSGNVLRRVYIEHGPEPAEADVVVSGEYEVGMQDQAFLGPESGLAVPAEDGGVELYVATQWLHVDQRQICSALGLPRLHPTRAARRKDRRQLQRAQLRGARILLVEDNAIKQEITLTLMEREGRPLDRHCPHS